MVRLDPEILLSAYAQGAFPMADFDGQIQWYTANPRGILPLERFHVSHTLRQLIRQRRFEIRINTCFGQVMQACSENREDSSWINARLIDAYEKLHQLGYAHSVEAWLNNELAGGLYGVSLGAAFFGESMFHRQKDASKVALVALVERLIARGYRLLDTQATTAHLERFGAIEIPADQYIARLSDAIKAHRDFVDPHPQVPQLCPAPVQQVPRRER